MNVFNMRYTRFEYVAHKYFTGFITKVDLDQSGCFQRNLPGDKKKRKMNVINGSYIHHFIFAYFKKTIRGTSAGNREKKNPNPDDPADKQSAANQPGLTGRQGTDNRQGLGSQVTGTGGTVRGRPSNESQ